MKYLVLFISLFSVAQADEIKFRNGQWVKNVLVKDTTDDVITVITPSDTRHFKLTVVEEILKAPYNPLGSIIVSDLGPGGRDTTTHTPTIQVQNIRREYPNLPFLSISILALAVSVELVSSAHEVSDDIDLLKDQNESGIYDGYISRLKKIKTRKEIIGWSLALGSLINLYWCTQSVEVRVEPDRIQLSYFP